MLAIDVPIALLAGLALAESGKNDISKQSCKRFRDLTKYELPCYPKHRLPTS